MWEHNHINFSNIPLTHKKTLFCCRGDPRLARVAWGGGGGGWRLHPQRCSKPCLRWCPACSRLSCSEQGDWSIRSLEVPSTLRHSVSLRSMDVKMKLKKKIYTNSFLLLIFFVCSSKPVLSALLSIKKEVYCAAA